LVIYDTSSIREPPVLKIIRENILLTLKVVKFCPFFKFAFSWPKLLPAIFLKKPGYPCPFEILEEALLCNDTPFLVGGLNVCIPLINRSESISTVLSGLNLAPPNARQRNPNNSIDP
jgi:hypothetical protein